MLAVTNHYLATGGSFLKTDMISLGGTVRKLLSSRASWEVGAYVSVSSVTTSESHQRN